MSECFIDQVRNAVFDRLDAAVKSLIKTVVHRFVLHVSPALAGEVDHAQWVEQTGRQRQELLQWLATCKSLDELPTICSLSPPTCRKLGFVSKASDILGFLVELPGKMAKTDVEPEEAVQLQRTSSRTRRF